MVTVKITIPSVDNKPSITKSFDVTLPTAPTAAPRAAPPTLTTGVIKILCSVGVEPPCSELSVYLDGTYIGKGITEISDVSPGTHELTFSAPGYDSLTVNVLVEANATTNVTFYGLQKAITTGQINILCSSIGGTPSCSDIEVYLDETYMGKGAAKNITDVSPGLHTLKFAYDNYEPYITSVNVTADKISMVSFSPSYLQPPAQAPKGYIYVDPRPPSGFDMLSLDGTDILINGVKKATYYAWTPVTIEVDPGTYNVVLQNPNFKVYRTTVDVMENETEYIEPTLEPLYTSLTIESVPDGADVWLEQVGGGFNSYVGKTPVTVNDLIPGKTYRVTIQLTGYYKYTDTIQLEKDPSSNYLSATLEPQVCVPGDTQTMTCPTTGEELVTAKCVEDPITHAAKWQDVAYECPVCKPGATQTMTCPDGTEITTSECKKDPTTGEYAWIPTSNECPPPELAKVVTLITPASGMFKAVENQSITISASVMCGENTSDGESAYLYINGSQKASGTTSGGVVSFTYTPSSDDIGDHEVCVEVPKSSVTECEKYGSAKDCADLSVSASIPQIVQQVQQEQEAYQQQLEQLRAQRQQISPITSTAAPSAPAPTTPTTPTVPTPAPTPVTPTPTPTAPTTPVKKLTPTGYISIPSVDIPPGYPFEPKIYLDGKYMGTPPITIEADVGTHKIRVELKNYRPIQRKVTVSSGATVTITDISFL